MLPLEVLWVLPQQDAGRAWVAPQRHLRAAPLPELAASAARCRRCDALGHMMAACPRPPTCHLCGESGHSSEDRCPNMFCFLVRDRDVPRRDRDCDVIRDVTGPISPLLVQFNARIFMPWGGFVC